MSDAAIKWTIIKGEIDRFQKFIDLLSQPFPKVQAYFLSTNKVILEGISDPLNPEHEFGAWVDKTYHHSVADTLYRERMEAFQRIQEGEDLREYLLILFKPYQDKIAFYLNKRGPIQFRVKGMVIQNPDRVPDSTLKEIFVPAINFMVDLFKKKGVSSILTKSVKTIEIINKLDGRSGSGFYHPGQRKIQLVNDGYSKVDWVRKVLIHEIGHHVHLSLLHPLAVKQWDSAWDSIHALPERHKEIKTISPQEIKRFWGLLIKVRGDLRKVKLKPLERMKFHAWLRSPRTPLVTPKQLRWTYGGDPTYGANLESLLKNPEVHYSYIRDPSERKQRIEAAFKRWKDRLRVSQGSLELNADEVKKYFDLDKSLSLELKKLGLPTEYAGTNVREDFAETFTYWMIKPEKLSSTARFRMRQALSMSGVYDKPLMRLARKKRALTAGTSA